VAEVDGWLRTGEVEASRSARVWVSPERARWAREARRVVEDWSDGSVIVERKLVELDYYKENEDELSLRTVEPYALTNGREGWYVASFDPDRNGVRHFRLDRIKRARVTDSAFEPRPEVDPVAEVDGWLRTGEVEASRSARVWVSPERARWAREARRVVEERSDGAVVVELSFAGVDWLVREILKEAGDAAVLEPGDARAAVHAAAARLRATRSPPVAPRTRARTTKAKKLLTAR